MRSDRSRCRRERRPAGAAPSPSRHRSRPPVPGGSAGGGGGAYRPDLPDGGWPHPSPSTVRSFRLITPGGSGGEPVSDPFGTGRAESDGACAMLSLLEYLTNPAGVIGQKV